jgi:hypothetical protein
MLKYKELIARFLENGYQTEPFCEVPSKNKGLLLRHDVDFDVSYAGDMSRVEDQLGVKSDYFFLLRSKSYNLLEPENIDQIFSILERGHRVSIHFDPSLYDDVEGGFRKERDLFEALFGISIDIVSIHRPSDYFLNNPKEICGVRHTYHPAYFDQVKYFSDSQGKFRFGHPIESEEFRKQQTLQLLIHPIWWKIEGANPNLILREYLSARESIFRSHVEMNCTVFRSDEENVK